MPRPRTRRSLLKAGLAAFPMLSGCASSPPPPTGSTDRTPPTTSSPTEPKPSTEQFPPPEPESETPDDPTPMQTESDWPQYQFDAGNTGRGDDIVGVPDDPDVYWQFYTRGTPPVLADGRLYAVEYATDRLLVARDAATGRQRWTTDLTGGAAATPAVADDRLIVLTYGTLFGFDRDDGAELWNANVGRGPPSAPIVDGDEVYIANGTFESWSAAAFAYSLDGEERWTAEVDGNVRGAPALVDDALVVAGSTGVYCFDVEDGTERWHEATDVAFETTVVADAETAYLIDESGTVHAIRASDGSTKWLTGTSKPGRGTGATLDDERLFVPTDDGLYALDRDDGAEQWHFQTAGPLTSPATDGDAVYVGATGFGSPTFHAVDAATGDERWNHPTREMRISDQVVAGVYGPPVLVDGGVYVFAADGLYAFGRAK